MFSDVIRQIEKQYELKKSFAEKQFENKKREIYAANPELAEIDESIHKLGIAMSKAILSGDKEAKEILIKELEAKVTILKKEKNDVIRKLNVELKPIYSCERCQDTGYIFSTSSGSEMCSCFKQQLINEAYNKSNLINLKKETFDKFNISLYSECIDEEKYGASISPKENAEMIKKIALEFVENFADPEEKNLLFSGTSGLGKTFLSSCIANEILKKGYTVLYETAPVLMDIIFEYKYNKPESSSETYKNLFNVNLLIIDDLGAENVSNAKFSELFTILNSRLLKPNTKTIISTNLTLQELFYTYGDRILSRIIGNYNACMFFGDDIRLK
jgi:DNA replication protein DnaC